MNARTQIMLDPEMQRRAQRRAVELGISSPSTCAGSSLGTSTSLNLTSRNRKGDISVIFDLIDEGSPTDIARDKDKMVGDAVWEEYLRDVGRKPRASRAKTGRG